MGRLPARPRSLHNARVATFCPLHTPTDAAAEGLNLQSTARHLLHFDCPWNPARLEQRNGRLDRHGQARDVFVYHFISTEDDDLTFLDYLITKVDRIREDLGATGELFDEATHRRLIEGADLQEVKESLEARIEQVRSAAKIEADNTVDRGAEDDKASLAASVAALADELDLEPGSARETLAAAMASDGSQPQLSEPDELERFRLNNPGLPNWKEIIDDAIRKQTSNRTLGPVPMLSFSAKPFLRNNGGRTIFRPRNDTVMLHLGHPLMTKALTTLTRRRFPGPAAVSRWTVRYADDVPEGADALLILYVEEIGINELRETFHHWVGVHQAAERAEQYAALRSDPAFVRLKEAFDLWCALWFWPPEQIEHAPLPREFAAGEISDQARAIARRLAAEHRFFHWELEFPDVFNADSEGFDAVFGNPPWEIAKPNSKEFFSAIDPLYRSYGKQEAINKQKTYFGSDEQTERAWLEYNAFFRAMSNWVKYAGFPFGDRVTQGANGKPSHDLNLGSGGRSSFDVSKRRHEKWRQKREESSGYADAEHAFRHQGSADINTYKMFLEQAHALLRHGGRLGMIAPSGIYSDHGTGALRELFLEHCRWEWLFGFENREKVFDIDSRFKFNPVIIQKGGRTEAIRTAFMRRQLADWERAEELVTPYPIERVRQFSPYSLALLEIQSQRDLEVLTKIYSNSVLLGDQGPDGWGIQYAREFDMTNDSRLFPPRPKWEEWGYRALLHEIERGDAGDKETPDSPAAGPARAAAAEGATRSDAPAGYLFDVEDRPLFQKDQGR